MSSVAEDTKTTAGDVRRAADIVAWVGKDGSTPPGHYIMTVKLDRLLVSYLLADDTDTVVGRLESHGAYVLAYAGGGIRGGQVLPPVDGEANLLRSILEARR